jgi:tetratricopeptide (TPR) repeat protein
MTMNRLSTLFIALTLVSACSSAPSKLAMNNANAADTASTVSAAADLPLVLALPNYPLSLQDRPTSPGADMLAHLEGKLAALPQSDTSRSRAMRAGLLYQRYQILGSLTDLDTAYDLTQIIANDPAADNDALFLSATVASYMHEFDRASTILDRVADGKMSTGLRAEIAAARSQTKIASARTELALGQEYVQLVQRANDCVDMGDLDCASENFHAAQFVYTDTAPLPLAWLHTQQGIALLRYGHPDVAIRFFRAALTRIPGYTLAQEHLAECLGLTGQFVEGRRQYLQVIERTANPEYMAGLAMLEQHAGRASVAQEWLEKAKVGYAQRLQKFPNAYAGHAINFYLDIGDVATAAKLAQDNLKLRQDASSYLLQAQVKFAQHDLAAACDVLATISASGRRPPEMMVLQKQLPSCVLNTASVAKSAAP